MTRALGVYGRLEVSVFLLFGAELLMNLINAAFTLVLNLYLSKLGYTDSQIAAYVSYRFLGVLLLSLPLGFWLRGRRLKPWLLLSAISLPIFSIILLEALRHRWDFTAMVTMLLWGVSYGIVQVAALPYMLRAVNRRWHAEAIALHYSNSFMGFILAGAFIFGLPAWFYNSLPFASGELTELSMLRLFCVLGLAAIPLMLGIQEEPPRERESRVQLTSGFLHELRIGYDWRILSRALLPTTIIAVGAGLTFPFVNLFFYQVFGMDSAEFGLLGAVASVLVVLGSLMVPAFKRRFGYRVVITLSQSLAVFFLIVLGLTELGAEYSWALPLAIGTYLIRQPLMNIAAPMTSELTLQYAGDRNREMVSALTSSIWSGSWFLSARIFQVMRAADLAYWQVFLFTAAFYSVGVIAYYRLILANERRLGLR
jgi:MFS-type transporter involved in bile tolerance (Atg22 family)